MGNSFTGLYFTLLKKERIVIWPARLSVYAVILELWLQCEN